jgi:Domain of unknown function (DUF4411)
MGSIATVYCMDSSSLIHATKRAYPPRRFPRLWAQIDELINVSRLVTSIEVYRELEKKDDDVFAWAKERRETLCREIDDPVQTELVCLMRAYPRLVDTKKGKSGGDPFVIALALAVDPHLVVVSEEKGGSENSPKIPFVCARENLRCIDLLGLIEEEDRSFG